MDLAEVSSDLEARASAGRSWFERAAGTEMPGPLLRSRTTTRSFICTDCSTIWEQPRIFALKGAISEYCVVIQRTVMDICWRLARRLEEPQNAYDVLSA